MLFLWALLWQPTPKKQDDDTFFDADGQLTREEMARFLRRVAMRLIMFVLGIIFIGYSLLTDMGAVDSTNAFLLFLGIYTIGLLVVQRAEMSRRLLVFFIFVFVGLLVWRYAIFRDVRAEHNWGLLTALLINLGFWILIGRHFAPEDKIEVITE